MKNIFDSVLRFFRKQKVELLVVLVLTIVNAFYLFLYKYTPTLDGGQHLYNSNVIAQLIRGNQVFSEFFEINSVIVGYWFAHAILSFFNLFLPAWLAEKIFLFIYLISTPFAFRYLVRSLNKNLYLPLLIFPVMLNGYYFMGYFAFIIAWPVLFVCLGYFFRNYTNNSFKKYLILGALFLLLYLSHLIVFAFGIAVVAAYLCYDLLYDWIISKNLTKKEFARWLRKSLFHFASVLLSVGLGLRYLLYVFQINAGTSLSQVNSKPADELISVFMNLSILVGFDHQCELFWNKVFFWFLIVLFSIVCLKIVLTLVMKQTNKNNIESKNKSFWFLLSMAILLMYFLLPNTFGTGNVSNRILILFLVSFVVCLAVFEYKWYIKLATIIFITLYGLGQFNKRQVYFEKQDILIADMLSVVDLMESQSTYLTIRCIDAWDNLHYGCYIGSEKPLICLNSPQNVGHYPVVWQFETAPKCYLGMHSPYNIEVNWFPGGVNGHIEPLDYVFVYGDYELRNNPNYAELKERILKYYEFVGKSEIGYGAVYKFKLESYINEMTDFINSHEDWPKRIAEKAEQKGISLEEMYYLDIMYMKSQE